MKLYLTRHGEAFAKKDDPERLLTPAGEQEIKDIAAALKSRNVCLSRIIHSGKKRAEQTAEIIASRVAPEINIDIRRDISPNDPVEPLVIDLETFQGDTMVVGHLPYIGEILYTLTHRTDIFNTGSTAVNERDDKNEWSFIEMINPGG